ncbi:MAG: hypothetical protein E7341_00835 [Clostridiales bacterium]|nr:hypothetical protein [Clostridiales bacterium]
MNWLDLGLILFLVIFIIIGVKRGFMTSVLSNFSFGIILVIAFFLSGPIASLLNSIFGLEQALFESHLEDLVAQNPDFSVNLLSLSKESLSPFIKLTLAESSISGIPRLMFRLFINKPSLYTTLHESGLTSRSLGDIVASSYASFYTKIIAFAVCVGLIYLILFLFKLLINKLRENGFVKVVDNILGVVYSIGKAFLTLIIICFVLNLLSPFEFMTSIENYINGSFFGRMLYGQINGILNNLLNYEDIIYSIFG